MEGLELRKAVLMAAGWMAEWVEPYGPYLLKLPNGNVWKKLYRNQAEDENDAWKHAPNVELSVDAALQWLNLPDGYYWKFVGYVTGLVEPGWTAYICKGDDTKVNYITDAESLPIAMCKAYLEYKQRG